MKIKKASVNYKFKSTMKLKQNLRVKCKFKVLIKNSMKSKLLWIKNSLMNLKRMKTWKISYNLSLARSHRLSFNRLRHQSPQTISNRSTKFVFRSSKNPLCRVIFAKKFRQNKSKYLMEKLRTDNNVLFALDTEFFLLDKNVNNYMKRG